MDFPSRKASLVILGLTSLVLSRVMFVFIDDPEGPNLLVVVVMAGILYALTLLAYRFTSSVSGLKKLLLVIATQILIVTSFYFLLG